VRETNPSNPIVVANEATTVSMLCLRRHKHTNDNLRKILCFIRCHRVAKYLTIDHNIHRENCHLKGVPIQTNPNKSYCWLCPTAKFPQRISISCCPIFAPFLLVDAILVYITSLLSSIFPLSYIFWLGVNSCDHPAFVHLNM